MIVIVQETGKAKPLPFATGSINARDFLVLSSGEMTAWLATHDTCARKISAFILCEPARLDCPPDVIRACLDAPILAVSARRSAVDIVDLLDAGHDDVVRLPVHVRELLARAEAIRRRRDDRQNDAKRHGAIVVVPDGRDPLVGGAPLALPRRERRILAFLAANEGRRVSRAQIFDATYDHGDREAGETAVESHVSRLRRKLRERLGYDPVQSKRHCGYVLTTRGAGASSA